MSTPPGPGPTQPRREIDDPVQVVPESWREDLARANHIVEANEQLILASLNAERIAQTAVDRLDALTRAGQRDVLTGTPNRQLMQDRLDHAIAVAKRNGSGIAVLFVDLDDFKRINDTLGHVVGDEVLIATARRLESAVRQADSVSRHGGDEFLVLLEISHPSAAAVIAKKMLARLTPPLHAGAGLLFVSASIGIAVYPGDGEDAGELIRHADTAMYWSKRRAHGHYAFYREAVSKSVDSAAGSSRSMPTARHPKSARFEQYQRQQQRKEREFAQMLQRLRDENAKLVAAAIAAERTAPAGPTSAQLELQTALAREFRSSFTPTQQLLEHLNEIHTSEPLLQVLIEREVAQISAAICAPVSSNTPSASCVRYETRKTQTLDAIASDGSHYTILEFTVTAQGGASDQTRRASMQKSYGLSNGDRVIRGGRTDFHIEETGVALSIDAHR